MSTGACRLFISYRREETAGHAGRLYDVMSARWGEGNVFMDVDLAPGVDFVERITEAVGACRVLLVVMGPQWATLTDDEQQVRIADPDDFVRLEVETALRRPDVTVIPLLIGRARMPDPDDLPPGLRALTRRNALELSDLRWRYDVQRLMGTLEEVLAGVTGMHQLAAPDPSAQSAQPRKSPGRAGSRVRVVLEGTLLAAAAGIAGRWLGELVTAAEQGTAAGRIADTLVVRGVTWALVGCAVAIWLTLVRGEGRALMAHGLGGLLAGAFAGALGGAIFGSRLLPETPVGVDVVRQLSVASVAATGAVLGGLVGRLWIPRHTGTGLLVGLVAGGLSVLLVILAKWDVNSVSDRVLLGGIQSVVIVTLVLAALLASDARRATD